MYKRIKGAQDIELKYRFCILTYIKTILSLLVRLCESVSLPRPPRPIQSLCCDVLQLCVCMWVFVCVETPLPG